MRWNNSTLHEYQDYSENKKNRGLQPLATKFFDHGRKKKTSSRQEIPHYFSLAETPWVKGK
jgi:hypothetical protein